MHPLDLSPRTSLPTKYPELELPTSMRNASERDNNNILNHSRRFTVDQGKRGRPRADLLTALMVEGSSSRSRIQCKKCCRVFPREKSLQAHLRTHTGERPYICDYPGCMKAFCQSGQLKTHQRLHTGERPFICIVDGCTSRFAHANRHCSQHPYASLKRLEMKLEDVAKLCEAESNPDVIKWINRYVKQCQERANTKHPLKKTQSSDSVDNVQNDVTTFDEDVSHNWSLPQIPSGQSFNTQPPLSTVVLTSTATSQSPPLFNPISISTLVPRQFSASSTASSSSSSGVSSLSESSKCSLPQDLTPENQTDIQDLIYSSHMILQGQYNDVVESCDPLLASYKNTSQTVTELSLMDYRAAPLPNSPVQPLSVRSYTSLLSKQLALPVPSRLPMVVPSSRPPTPTPVNLPSTAPPVKPPTTVPQKLLISKQPTLPGAIIPVKASMSCKPPSPEQVPRFQALPLSAESFSSTSGDLKTSESISTETTSSISYRTTPKNREKDRYISALALIELSKG